MNVCYICKNSTWAKCYMTKSGTSKCDNNCSVCKNKKYIRCYVCEKGKQLLIVDKKPYAELTFDMFYIT